MDMKLPDLVVALAVAVCVGVIYLATPNPPTLYQHHVYQAAAFLKGQPLVSNFPDYYHDVVTVPSGLKAPPFPPLPAVLLMPLVALNGLDTPEFLVSQLVGAVNVGLMYLLLRQTKKTQIQSLIWTTLYGLGSIHFYLSVVGNSWFYAQVVGQTFLIIALYCALKKAPLFAGLALGLAGLARVPIILAVPAVFFLAKPTTNLKKAGFIIIFLGAFSLYFLFNWWRFGTPKDLGYYDIYLDYTRGMPITLLHKENPAHEYWGYMDLRNIPLHLYAIFLYGPELTGTWPYLKFSPYGLALTFTTPLLLAAFAASLKKSRPKLYWLAAGLIMIPNLLHFGQGWVQFGYRYLVDAYPLLVLLASLAIPKFNPIFWLLYSWSLLINFLGVLYAPR